MPRPTPEQLANRPSSDRLRELYEVQRLTTRQIAAIYGVDKVSVCRWLKKFGIEARDPSRGLANRGIEPPTRDDLIRMVHDEHMSYAQIAEVYGVDGSAIRHWLIKHEIERPKVWDTRTKGNWVRPDIEEVKRLYGEGSSTIGIGDALGVSAGLIQAMLREAGVEMRPANFSGVRYNLSSGMEVRSSYEVKTGNWLIENSVPFTYEPRYPFQQKLFADFLANDWYIEIWGIEGEESYDEKRKLKTALCEEYQLPLIELEPWHFSEKQWHVGIRELRKTLSPAPRQGWLF